MRSDKQSNDSRHARLAVIMSKTGTFLVHENRCAGVGRCVSGFSDGGVGYLCQKWQARAVFRILKMGRAWSDRGRRVQGR